MRRFPFKSILTRRPVVFARWPWVFEEENIPLSIYIISKSLPRLIVNKLQDRFYALKMEVGLFYRSLWNFAFPICILSWIFDFLRFLAEKFPFLPGKFPFPPVFCAGSAFSFVAVEGFCL